MPTIETPAKDNKQYSYFYRLVSKAQQVVMLSHVFHMGGKYKIYPEYNIILDDNISGKHGKPADLVLFLQDNKLYIKIDSQDPIEVKQGYAYNQGLPQTIYNSIFIKLQNLANKKIISENLQPDEEEAIYKFISYHSKPQLIDGAGSLGNLMLHEFKTSFASYQQAIKSTEVNQIANFIEDFKDVKDIDTATLRKGKYQAIKITTAVTSSGAHAETILTNGDLLFWANRGSEAGRVAGIKVFKIIKDMKEVRAAMEWLKESHSQTDTRDKIYSLLRKDSDNNVPLHVMIKLPEQSIGNCGWAQVESMLKAIAIVNRLKDLDILKAELFSGNDLKIIQNKISHLEESQEWQKILKDTDDIYQDFLRYDQVTRLEALVFIADKDFTPKFLNQEIKNMINNQREIAGKLITYDLWQKLLTTLRKERVRFINTKYEKQLLKMIDRIDLEVAAGSKMGESLQFALGITKARKTLEDYQHNKNHDFDYLSKIYHMVEGSRIKSKEKENKLFVGILTDIMSGRHLTSLKDIEKRILVALK